ncbi:MAG: hypothetical protein LBL48_03260 [Azoarcus sp.]|jgi:pilus assembly protein FimV|nr:hypothetical protein [Azoarcus sp.]
MKPTIKASLIAAAIALMPLGAQAAGLGQITVQSRLGEPLNAEVQINATPQELQTLSVRIAPPEAFLQANVPYAGFVPGIKVEIENRGGRSVLKLSSNAPVNEAVASLIVQMNWDDGRLSRTYNFLLDPADLAIRPPAPVAPPVAPPQVEPAMPSAPVPDPLAASEPVPDPRPESSMPPVPEPELSAAPAPEPEFARSEPPMPVPQAELPPPIPSVRTAAPEGDYAVKYGDTLGRIARSRMPDDVTLDQMVMALYRVNASAFTDNNINRLKTGAILKMPSADDVRNINTIEARREVRVQTRDFNAWRERLAEGVASQPPRTTEEDSGRTRGIDTVPPVAEQDRDKVVIASGGDAGQGGGATRLRQLEEDIAATQSSLKDAKERVGELEEINKNLDALLALRNQELAKLQNQLNQPGQPPAPPPELAQATPPPAPPVTAMEPPPVPTPPPAVPETVATAESASPPEVPAPPPEVPAPPPEPVAAVDEPIAAAEEEDPLLELITDPQALGMGALIIALLGGFLGFRSWQRKRADAGLDTLSQDTSMFSSEATSIFGDNGGQSVDTSASSVIHTDFSQTGLSIDTNEGVDPVAEADVYMAYGRDTQAEEILNDALKADPKRGAIYVKLLEIYAQRQDLAQFEATATELYSRTQGQGRDWEKATQMGHKLDPANPLYNNSASGSEVTALHTPDFSNLDLTAVEQAANAGPALAELDFSATSTSANAGQSREAAAQNRGDDLLASLAVAEDADVHFDLSEEDEAANASEVDFDLGADARAANNGTVRPVDFDKSNAKSVQAKPAVRQVAGVASRRTATAAVRQGNVVQAAANASGGIAVPLEFDLSDTSRSARPGGRGAASSATPSSMRGGTAPETSFDPHALDFDLDLDSGDDVAVAAPPRAKSKAPAAPAAPELEDEPGEASEIDTKLELARAYEDMGDTEGALELLREVVAEGNATQKAAAQALIDKLS